MTLTHRTDFALRTLMYLATLESSSRRATSAEIAKVFDISVNHLVKVISDLARHGYIETSRGLGGGIELALEPEEIRLGEFIEVYQGPLMMNECVASEGVCVIETFCKLKGIFSQADQLQRTFLNGFTLADFIPAPRKLAALASSS